MFVTDGNETDGRWWKEEGPYCRINQLVDGAWKKNDRFMIILWWLMAPLVHDSSLDECLLASLVWLASLRMIIIKYFPIYNIQLIWCVRIRSNECNLCLSESLKNNFSHFRYIPVAWILWCKFNCLTRFFRMQMKLLFILIDAS